MPPPPDDEPVYLTIAHPYPLDANLEVVADQRALALWLACCTGNTDVLLAMFHDPTSPGTVIIEMDREFDGFRDMLGTHKWSEFLLNPTQDELGMTSTILYYTGRLVEKDDWTRVSIEEHWFQGWSPNNSRIKYPYPGAAYCDVPPGPPQPMRHPLPPGVIPVLPPQPTSIGLRPLYPILGVCLLILIGMGCS